MRQRTSGQRPRKCGYSIRHEVLVTAIGSDWDCRGGDIWAHHDFLWIGAAARTLSGYQLDCNKRAIEGRRSVLTMDVPPFHCFSAMNDF